MNPHTNAEILELARKIGRLVEEWGWNQEDLARAAGLNRQTVRKVLQPSENCNLRSSTISRCARALGLTVSELRQLPLASLIQRMGGHQPLGNGQLRMAYESATQPELVAWLENHPERAKRLTADGLDELLSLQGTGGPLTQVGVEHFVELIERRQRIVQQVEAISNTDHLNLLEKLVGALYENIQPYPNRGSANPSNNRDGAP